MNKKKIITGLLFIIVFVAIVFATIVFVLNKKEIIRGAYWGDSLNKVVKREQKLDPDSNIVINEKSIQVNDVTLFNEPCYIAYKFEDNNKLFEIECGFHTNKGTTFEQLEEQIKLDFGEADSYKDMGTISQTKIWITKNMKIELEYAEKDTSSLDWSDLSITYTIQK